MGTDIGITLGQYRIGRVEAAHLILEVFWRAQVPWDRKIKPFRAAVDKVYHGLRKTSPQGAGCW